MCIDCNANVKAHAELGFLPFVNGHKLTLKTKLKIWIFLLLVCTKERKKESGIPDLSFQILKVSSWLNQIYFYKTKKDIPLAMNKMQTF